jgi:quinol monooxygenase YgiN
MRFPAVVALTYLRENRMTLGEEDTFKVAAAGVVKATKHEPGCIVF